MPDYHFYKKGKQTIALEHWDEGEACRLLNDGYEKQPEEINAVTKKKAHTRFSDIRRDNQTDQNNFLAGAGTMPLIGILTAVAAFLLRKRKS